MKMLYGLALENLLKACIVKRVRGAPAYSARRKLDWGVKPPHNLRVYAEKAGILTNVIEHLILDDLTDSITWQGRYPIPMGADWGGWCFKGYDLSQVVSLYSRIRAQLV